MSNILKYLAVFIGGGVLCFLLFRGCGKNSAIQTLQDSLNIEKVLNDTIIVKASGLSKSNDSLMAHYKKDTGIYRHKIDSLTKVTITLKKSFLHTADTIRNLHDRLDSAFAANDTAGVWDLADSLNNELTRASNLLFAWQISRDSSDYLRENEIDTLHVTLSSLQTQLIQIKTLLKDCTDNSTSLSKTASSAIKKSKINGLLSKVGIGLAAVLAVFLLANH